MMDLTNAAESIEIVENPSPINNGKFFKITGMMFIVGWIVAIALPTGVHTSLTQNIVKTTLVVYIGFSIFYSFICLYRVLAKKKIIRTLKEILLTLVFMLWLYNILVLIDMPLMAMNRDLEAVPSNIIAFSLIAVFLIFQAILFRKDQK